MRKNKSAHGRKRRGRKQQPLEIEVEFIGGEEARRRWDAIFKLLEAEKTKRSEDSLNEADGPEYDQLRLF